MKSTSRFAIVAAAGMFVGGLALTSAKAADLGGDCCADLEERVADLEATTVRKGNKKVSLTISGSVSRVIGWYGDNYGDSEMYSSGTGVNGVGTRISFDGSAKLTPSWTAGYGVRLRMSDGYNAAQAGNVPGGPGNTAVVADRNFVYLKNDTYGTFLIGQAGALTNGVASISFAGSEVVANSSGSQWNGSDIQGFNLEQDIAHQAIAWVSPTIAGFTFGIAWADLSIPADIANNNAFDSTSGTDALDMALRYAGEFGPVRIAAGIGYTTVDDHTLEGPLDVDGANLMGSLALMHTPTGLNVAFATGREYNGGLPQGTGFTMAGRDALIDPIPNGVGTEPDASFWHVQGGINQNFFGYGNTAIYGEYGSYDDGSAPNGALVAGTNLKTNDPTTTMWGLGVVQNFDAAATELFVAYRSWEDGDAGRNANAAATACVPASGSCGTDKTVDQVMAGMRIKF